MRIRVTYGNAQWTTREFGKNAVEWIGLRLLWYAIVLVHFQDRNKQLYRQQYLYELSSNYVKHLGQLYEQFRNQWVNIRASYFVFVKPSKSQERIRFRPESYIQTRYPTTAWQYILRTSRWNRSFLLHHYHLDDQRWIRNCLSVCRFQMLLAQPLLPLFIGKPGLAIWSTEGTTILTLLNS